MEHSTALCTTDALSIGYPEKELAQDLNLRFNKGELHAIIGVNGIGKSTLLQTLCGQLAALSGDVRINDKSIQSYAPSDLSTQIGVVFTHRRFSQNLSVYDLIALGRHPYTNFLGQLSSNDKTHIQKALQLLGIDTLSDQKCINLSDGQLQKVLIARVLAQDTPLIFMDEPTHHLDFYNRAFVMRLLKRLTRDFNKCVVYSTHEINMGLQLSDSILLLRRSHALQKSPQDLITSGHLDDLFPQDEVEFNKADGVFKIRDL